MEPLAPEDLVEDWSDLSTSTLGVGAHLGRYELLLPVAYGGMARVWAARLLGHRGFSKLVAIKTILPHLAHSAEFERMFLDEARIAAGVHHPNVTEIYELGEEGHVLYLAMEWVNGDSLVHVVRGLNGKNAAPIDPRLGARIAADACAGLHAAHELVDESGHPLGVVHRDVSPHNILVSMEGTVKVTDFGVAKALGQSHQATVAGQIKGKVAYMAPEAIASNTVDRRTDIFAMGCVLYETTTGQLPFRGGNDPQVMQAVLKGAYAPPPSVIRGFPLELAGIIDRALAGDPEKRFATAEQMRMALEEWLAKSGPIVTQSHVAALVRQRLGAHLDQRREQVRSAMASVGDAEGSWPGRARPAAGQTPSALRQGRTPNPLGQSHSGVVPTSPGAPRGPALPPPVMSPTPGPVAAPLPPPRPPPLPIVKAPPRAAASGTKYALAAVAGVVFAILVGVATLMALEWNRSPAAQTVPSALPPPTSAVTAPAATAQTAPPAGATAANAQHPAAPAQGSAAAPRPSSAPATVDVNDLPAAKPSWLEVPAGGARGAPPPAPTKPPALPANPY